MEDNAYVEEVPGVEAIAVQGDGSITHEQVDELRYELLGVLMGSIDVVAPRDDEGEVEGARVGLGNELGAGFGGGVGVGGL